MGVNGVHVAQSLVFCVVYCRSLNIFFLLAIVLSVLLRFTDSDSPFSIFKLFLLAIMLDRNSKMEYGINKVINDPLVGGAWLQAFINTTANSAPIMTTIDLQDSLYTSRQWLNKSMNCYLQNSLPLILINYCCNTWGVCCCDWRWSNSSHMCSIGFKSVEFDGHGITEMFWFCR